MLVCRHKRVVPARSGSKKNLDHTGSLKAKWSFGRKYCDRINSNSQRSLGHGSSVVAAALPQALIY